jgi:hypothetical protein
MRLAYFGDIVPQPVHVKVSGLGVSRGLTYLRRWAWRPEIVLPALLLVVAAARERFRSSTVLLLWLALAATIGSVVTSGGDWMEAGRMLVPAQAIAGTLAGIGVTRLGRSQLCTLAASTVVALQMLGTLRVASTDSTGAPIWAHTASASLDVDPGFVESRPWFETRNRIHLRDALFVPALREVVDDLAARGQRVTVSSGQGGMVPYYLFLDDQVAAEATFIDTARLTTDDFTHCPDGLTDSPFGRVMTFEYWFSHTDQCQVPLPDVVFAPGSAAQFPSLDGRYSVVFQQPQEVFDSGSGRLPGANVDLGQFIAVRNDLKGLIRPVVIPLTTP